MTLQGTFGPLTCFRFVPNFWGIYIPVPSIPISASWAGTIKRWWTMSGHCWSANKVLVWLLEKPLLRPRRLLEATRHRCSTKGYIHHFSNPILSQGLSIPLDMRCSGKIVSGITNNCRDAWMFQWHIDEGHPFALYVYGPTVCGNHRVLQSIRNLRYTVTLFAAIPKLPEWLPLQREELGSHHASITILYRVIKIVLTRTH